MSKRFGTSKLLEKIDGKPLVRIALEAAQGACPGNVCLVVGHDAQAIVAASSGTADRIITNAHYESGIGTSIACGVRDCRESSEAVIVMLADQPFVRASHLRDIIARWSEKPGAVVASAYAGTFGPPILFPAFAFDSLELLDGDSGAKAIIKKYAFERQTIDFEPAGIDIDRQDDLETLQCSDVHTGIRA